MKLPRAQGDVFSCMLGISVFYGTNSPKAKAIRFIIIIRDEQVHLYLSEWSLYQERVWFESKVG